MDDPLAVIEEGCYLALRLGLTEAPGFTNCLVVRDGLYLLSPAVRSYHPLETILVGEPVCAATWLEDALARLGVTAAWAEGFVDGFAQSGKRSAGQDYTQGFLTAMELTQRCYRRLLKGGGGE